MNDAILVFDIGGTKLAAGLLMPNHTVAVRRQLPTLASEGATAILTRLITLGRQVLTAGEAEGISPIAIGVATGGQVDAATGTVVHATENIPGWSGLALGRKLTEALALPAFVENDANCFALAEAVLGAGVGYRHLLVVAIGTGVGSGIMVDGQLYSGWQGKAGEVGHAVLVAQDGRPCTCGRSGCLESYTATRIIVERSGYPSIQAVAADYTAGHSIPAVDEAAAWLGVGLASLAHIVGPEAIVVGGSVGLLGERYLTAVRAAFLANTMPSYRMIPILPAQLAADSGLLGAGIFARRSME
jgi:glucokinase